MYEFDLIYSENLENINIAIKKYIVVLIFIKDHNNKLNSKPNYNLKGVELKRGLEVVKKDKK